MPKRLRAGLLGREALGVAGRPLVAPVGFLPLDLGEDTVEEALAIPFKGMFDPPDVDEVVADAKNHDVYQAPRSPWASARARSINARMRLMVPSKPPKIASPIRK